MHLAARMPPVTPARSPAYRQRSARSAQITPAPTSGLTAAHSIDTETNKKEKGKSNSGD